MNRRRKIIATIKRYLCQWSTWEGFIILFCVAYLIYNFRHITPEQIAGVATIVGGFNGAKKILTDSSK